MPPDPHPTPEPGPDSGELPGEPAPAPRRRRPPPSRLAPDALARSRPGGAMEGLAWLGREPEARASILYRVVRLFARFVLFGLFRFRITATGRERSPTGSR